jgi:hypothetical protein
MQIIYVKTISLQEAIMKKLTYIILTISIFALTACGSEGEATYGGFPYNDIYYDYGFYPSEPSGHFTGGYSSGGVMRLVWSNVDYYDYKDYIRELSWDIPHVIHEGYLPLSGDAEGYYFVYEDYPGKTCRADFIWARGLFYYESDTLYPNNAMLRLDCGYV